MILFKSLIYYIIGYLIVTTIASLHFLFNWKVKGQEAFDTRLGIKALKENATQFEAFKSTKPFHPIYNIVVFTTISVWMINNLYNKISIFEAISIGTLWIVYCFLFDIIFWVIVAHPWRLTIKELFITYQPWITLAYLAILISPIIAKFILYITI